MCQNNPQEFVVTGKGTFVLSLTWKSYVICVDGELYAGITSDFMSRDSAFFRSLGSRHVIRTEQYDSTWLQGKWKKNVKEDQKRVKKISLVPQQTST